MPRYLTVLGLTQELSKTLFPSCPLRPSLTRRYANAVRFSIILRKSWVYEKWRFINKSTRGLSITALFSGISGIGKAMSAEVIAI
jgi:hypothetical protein